MSKRPTLEAFEEEHYISKGLPVPTHIKVEADYLVAQQVAVIEGNTCIVVTCHDFDHYKRLPAVISYNGVMCGKTGWNSDTNRCHYQSNASLVRVCV